MVEVDTFLASKRLAIVGMSRDEKQLSRHLLKAFVDLDYTVIPVNASADEIDGLACAKSLREIEPPVDTALVMLAKDKMKTVADEAVAAGVKNLWLYGVTGPREIPEDVTAELKEKGINVIAGYCPFMFLEGVETGHRIHAWIWKAIGMMPKQYKLPAKNIQTGSK